MTQTGPRFIHNPHASDVFADGIAGTNVLDSNMAITFTSLRPNFEKKGEITYDEVVIGRVILPIVMAEKLSSMIQDQLRAIQTDQAAVPPKSIQ